MHFQDKMLAAGERDDYKKAKDKVTELQGDLVEAQSAHEYPIDVLATIQNDTASAATFVLLNASDSSIFPAYASISGSAPPTGSAEYSLSMGSQEQKKVRFTTSGIRVSKYVGGSVSSDNDVMEYTVQLDDPTNELIRMYQFDTFSLPGSTPFKIVVQDVGGISITAIRHEGAGSLSEIRIWNQNTSQFSKDWIHGLTNATESVRVDFLNTSTACDIHVTPTSEFAIDTTIPTNPDMTTQIQLKPRSSSSSVRLGTETKASEVSTPRSSFDIRGDRDEYVLEVQMRWINVKRNVRVTVGVFTIIQGQGLQIANVDGDGNILQRLYDTNRMKLDYNSSASFPSDGTSTDELSLQTPFLRVYADSAANNSVMLGMITVREGLFDTTPQQKSAWQEDGPKKYMEFRDISSTSSEDLIIAITNT